MNKPFVVSLLTFLTAMSGVTYYALKNQTAHIRGTNVAGTDEVYQAWTQWLSSYGKQYQHDELPLRYATFTDNYNYVKNFNTQKKSFQVGLNQFADLSNQEFAALQQGQLTPKASYQPKSLKSLGIPQSVDWRAKGGVTPVKNQGQCGSCYTFSSTGALEGLYFVKNGNLISFSEQQLVDCSQSYGNNGCNGGLMDNCFQYVQDKGIELESAYPYTGKDSGSCNYDQSKTKFSNTGFQDVVANSTDQLQAALALQPVSVAIEADQNSFQFYSGGIYNDESCGTNLDHGVLAVGYGVENGQSYYIIKNSWGPTWGDKGFIRIAATDGPSICGVQMQPSYPTA